MSISIPAARWRRAALALVAALAFGVAFATSADQARAYDKYPCFYYKDATFWWWSQDYPEALYKCPLWRGHVPVYESRSIFSPQVGELVRGGTRNWFIVEKEGVPVRLGRSENNYWASTMADNGRWGWVPEVYFSGGLNNEHDRGLLGPNWIPRVTPPWRD